MGRDGPLPGPGRSGDGPPPGGGGGGVSGPGGGGGGGGCDNDMPPPACVPLRVPRAPGYGPRPHANGPPPATPMALPVDSNPVESNAAGERPVSMQLKRLMFGDEEGAKRAKF